MKAFALFVIAGLLAGTTLVRAQTSQELDSIVAGPFGFTLKAKLSDGTSVTDTTLGGNLSAATFELLNINPNNGHTNCFGTVDVIGSSLGTSNYIDIANGITNVVMAGVLIANNSGASLGKGKQASAFGQEAAVLRGTRATKCGDCDPLPGFAVPEDVISNSVWYVLLNRHASGTSTSFTGQVVGIWKDGETAFKGTIKSTK